MKKLFVLLIAMVMMVGAASAATVNLVEKNWATDWSVVSGGKSGILAYTMPCPSSTMSTYAFTSCSLTPGKSYSLVFYSRTDAGTWNPDTVWANQDTTVIASGAADGSGCLTLSGTFDFSIHGKGLECIADGKDYDGTVKGAKVWLIPSSCFSGSAVTCWPPNDFLWEESLVACEPTSVPEPALLVGLIALLVPGMVYIVRRKR
ncbi:PEP-CTERM sorting domain-containing protein [Candidatus Babeliales bacterium]|nr:PEP-CTERM sorting domain-containing protein [Candidatus Babeliales bacterium]